MITTIYQAGKILLWRSAKFIQAMRLGWQIAHRPPAAKTRRHRRVKTVSLHPPGVFYVCGNHPDRFEITARMTRSILPGLYADLLHALGERVLLVIREASEERPAQETFSFSLPMESARLRRVFFDYGDVIAHHDAMELTAQNTEKTGNLILTSGKLLFLEASCPQRFIHTLIAHGLRRVPCLEHTAKPAVSAALHAVEEWRLVEFKQQLGLSATAFYPCVDLIH